MAVPEDEVAHGNTIAATTAAAAAIAATGAVNPERVAATERVEGVLRPAATAVTPRGKAGAGVVPGTKIGRFMVVERLGQGGMGTVYAAYDADLDRKIAVKLLRADSLAEHERHRARNRLLREARAMARLADPNVLTIHEVGTFTDQVFIAMEFAAGGTIRQWHERGQPSWREVVERFIAAGRGLAAAHAAGMVHRDFKPDNILIGSDGQVKVADFGLVSTVAVQTSFANESASLRLRPSTPLSVSLTHTGTLLGTPTYMAPEQLRNRPATAASDQFAFCVSLYELLYGQRPFSDRSFDELSRSVCSGVIKDPPRRSEVPRWLHRALAHGMARRPEDRFANMEALLDALASDPDAKVTRQRRRRRHRAGLAALAAAAATLTTVAVIKLTSAQSSLCHRPDQAIAELWNDAVDEELRVSFAATGRGYAMATANLVANNISAYVGRWQQTHIDACEDNQRGEQSARLLDLRMSCLDQRKRELAALLELLGHADGALVDTAVQAVRALPSPSRCEDAASLLMTTPLPEDQVTRRRLSELEQRQAQHLALDRAGRYAEALTIAESVLVDARAIGFEPAIAQALHDVGDLQYSLSDPAAEATLEAAFLSADRANLDSVRADAATLLASVAAEGRGRPADGLRWGRIAAAIASRLPDRVEHEAFLFDAIGRIHDFAGNMTAAAATYQRALERWQELADGDDARMAHTLNNLGNALNRLGQHDEAMAQYQRALAIYEASPGAAPGGRGITHGNIASSYLDRHDLARAAEHFTLALTSKRQDLGDGHPSVAHTLHQLAFMAESRGDSAGAIAHLEEARQICVAKSCPAYLLPEIDFALAKVLPRRDRGRARKLAAEARAAIAARPAAEHDQLGAEVDAWLARTSN